MAAPEADVAALARLSGLLRIPPRYVQGVAIQLVALQAQAQLVMDLELDETTESAPIFVP